MVTKRQFTCTSSHHWWPRRKDEEGDREVALDKAKADSFEDPLNPNRIQSTRHEALKRIHVLGVGNLGAFVAHSLAGIPQRPPITLLLHRRQLRMWEDCHCSIEIITRGVKETRRGFEAEAVRRLREDSSIPVENHSGKGEDFLKKTVAEAQEGSLPEALTLETEDISDVHAPVLEESNLPPDDCHQQDRTVDKIAPQDSVSELGESSTPEAGINALFAQAEQEIDEAQHEEKDMMASEQIRTPDTEHEGMIYHLIVSVKAFQTVRAIQAVAHRLTQDSSILFLQNGVGMVDEVNQKLFPNENYRPTYIIGVVSHGLYSKRSFSVVHAGEGTIALGVLPRTPVGHAMQPETLNQLSTSARYIMRTMTRTAVLVAVGFSPTDLLQQQLDKLAVNSIINPLTAILDCKNGALLYNFYFQRVVRLLLAEISIVIKSLPELKNVPNVSMRFDTLRLERMVFSIATTTAENYSSMLQDIRSGRLTEIDYINGYIIKRGEEMGIQCVMNYMLMHMVKGKNKNTSQEKADLLPLSVQSN